MEIFTGVQISESRPYAIFPGKWCHGPRAVGIYNKLLPTLNLSTSLK